ncbi:MBOAT family O-acyltransferase [Duganella vulcania]|uniref:Probable alginate O-acetylase AlgI n=1 Tax=Duganella vulcania TaxID=2692166 RepID=A0A845GU40_9BURK|nr:MBOAT family protein [Duganella vulcania]MYM98003.1 MBOAT family protein [Duganella vulcania]
MVFTSFNFLIFFPLVIVLYYLTPARLRSVTILAANYFFYINIKPVFALLLAAVTFIAYCATLLMERTSGPGARKAVLQSAIVLILLPLFFFKYFGEINDAIALALQAHQLHWPLPPIKMLLPIGISFYTFMALGYVIDVYYEEIECEKNIGQLAAFISFFPLILSGPIERAGNMLPQLKAPRVATFEQFSQGCKLMLWGYFLKMVVADRVGIYVDAVYGNIERHNGTSLLFASCLYPFQIYADLGGYSLLAIGVSKILGFDIIPNFNRPFFATSMSDFWRRWHMSLISWVNDYIYTPLSFSLRSLRIWGIIISLTITFVISGVWHGPSMTFVVWGLLQGMFLSIEVLLAPRRSAWEKKHAAAQNRLYLAGMMVLTFIMFAASMVFSRAATIGDGLAVYARIFTTSGPLYIEKPSTMIYILFGIAVMMAKDFTDEFTPSRFLLFKNKSKVVRTLSYSLALVTILLVGVLDGGQFIYFQF